MAMPLDHPFCKSWDAGRRGELKSGKIKGSFAGPGESYPVAGPEDVKHAWDLAGHASDPQEVRRNIMRIAKEHGWEHGLPGTAKDELDAHEGARETMKAVVKGYTKIVHGKVIPVQAYNDKRTAAMKKTMHAAGATKEANEQRTPDAHRNAATMHGEAAKLHTEAHAAAPHEVKGDHESLAAHHKMLSDYHAGMADMVGSGRDFLKAHVKAHYRFVNGKSVYVKEHGDSAPVGIEANLQQRTQVAKHVKTGDLHLRAFDADDRDAILEHAKKLGIDATVKRQAGHLHYSEGGKGDHAFYQIHAGSDENAMKLHHSLGANKKMEADKASDLANEASDKASDASAMLDGEKADPSKHHLAAHDAHTSAVLAHHEAMLANKEVGNKEMTSYHDEKSKGHAKLADEHMAKHKQANGDSDYAKAAKKADEATTTASNEGTHASHIAAAEAHAEAAGKTVEGSTAHKHHMRLNKIHGQMANTAHEVEQGKAEEAKAREAHYLENSKAADKATVKANGMSNELKPQPLEGHVKEHEAAKAAHEDAHSFHYESAKTAPTDKLHALHQSRAEHHANLADIHEKAIFMGKTKNAKTKSIKANGMSGGGHVPSPEEHEKAIAAHEDALNAHTAVHEHIKARAEHDGKSHQSELAFTEGQMERHTKMGLYHNTAKHALEATAKANDGGGKEDHDKAAYLHQEAAKQAKEMNLQVPAKYHATMSQAHASDNFGHEPEAPAPEAAKPEAPASSVQSIKDEDAKKPWHEQDLGARATDAEWASASAESPEDHAKAAGAHKHAAIIAHHKAEHHAKTDEPTLAAHFKEKAMHHVAKAKEHEAKSKEVKKAVDEKPMDAKQLRVHVIEAARTVLRQSNEKRYIGKALTDLPAAGGLRDACLKATAAGIMGMPKLLAIAVGGDTQAAPLLAILDNGQ